MNTKKFLLILVPLSFCLGTIQAKEVEQAKEVDSPIKKHGWFEKNYDPHVFSDLYMFLLTAVEGYTFRELRINPEEYEGFGHGTFGDHGFLGFVLHSLGYLGQKTHHFKSAPEKIQWLVRLGHFLVLEDAHQHLIRQRHDNYGSGKSGTDYEIGLIQKIYRFSLQEGRNQENLTLLLELVEYKKISVGVGYFQGPGAYTNLELLKIFEKFNIGTVVILTGKHHLSKELIPEQVSIGASLEFKVNDLANPYLFTGYRIMDKCQNSPWAVGVGIKF